MTAEQKRELMAAQPKPCRKLEVPFKEGMDFNLAVAGQIHDPATKAAAAATMALKASHGELDLMASVRTLRQSITEVQAGDLKQADAMLVSQAYTMDAVFTECLRMWIANQFTNPTIALEYLRVGLKTQGQVRALWESVSKIHHPIGPATFVKQANIANGPQQVNNGTEATRVEERDFPAKQTIGGPGG